MADGSVAQSKSLFAAKYPLGGKIALLSSMSFIAGLSVAMVFVWSPFAPLLTAGVPLAQVWQRAAIGAGLILVAIVLTGGFIARRWERPYNYLSRVISRTQTQLLKTQAQNVQLRKLLHASLNALPARLAVLDASGRIILSNNAWQEFAKASGSQLPNYLDACESDSIRAALESVIEGRRANAQVRYGVDTADGEECFQARMARFDHGDRRWFVVVHENITEIEHSRRTVDQLASQLNSLQERERQWISRELHDSTAQHLVAAGLSLMRLKEQKSAEAREQICKDIKASLSEAQKELRVFTYLLHPPRLDTEGLHETVARFIDGFSQRTGIRAKHRTDRQVDALPFELQRTVFRVLQEALANVHRHADATRVVVLITIAGGRLLLRVKDNGRGVARDWVAADALPLGIGVPGMSARIERFAGRLTLVPRRKGTLVSAIVPLRDPTVGTPAAPTIPLRLLPEMAAHLPNRGLQRVALAR